MSRTFRATIIGLMGIGVAGTMAVVRAAQQSDAAREQQTPRYVVIGCIRAEPAQTDGRSAPSAEGRVFLITDRRDRNLTFRLQAEPDVLDRHTGHLVEVAGDIQTGSGGDRGGTPTLVVKSLIYLSQTCAP